MTISTFMFAADALRLEEGVDWTVTPEPGKPRAPRADVGEKNAQAVQSFMAGMAGLGKRKR